MRGGGGGGEGGGGGGGEGGGGEGEGEREGRGRGSAVSHDKMYTCELVRKEIATLDSYTLCLLKENSRSPILSVSRRWLLLAFV